MRTNNINGQDYKRVLWVEFLWKERTSPRVAVFRGKNHMTCDGIVSIRMTVVEFL